MKYERKFSVTSEIKKICSAAVDKPTIAAMFIFSEFCNDFKITSAFHATIKYLCEKKKQLNAVKMKQRTKVPR